VTAPQENGDVVEANYQLATDLLITMLGVPAVGRLIAVVEGTRIKVVQFVHDPDWTRRLGSCTC
jgi:hypothetical protein